MYFFCFESIFLILLSLSVVCYSNEIRQLNNDGSVYLSSIETSRLTFSQGFLASSFDTLQHDHEISAADNVLHTISASNVGDVTTYGGAWKVIGAGLVKLVEFVEVVIKGTCISISVEAGQTCGGLKQDTCSRLNALRDSVEKLKKEALKAIEENDDLLRWNATNVHVGLEMEQIAQIMDDVITINARLMDRTDTLNYDAETIAIRPGEVVGESGASLADFKFYINMEPLNFIRKVSKYLEYAQIDEKVKDKIAFGVALGVSMSSQCVPDVLRGLLGLDENISAVKDRLLVILESARTNVTFGYQLVSRRQFLTNITRGAAEEILADAQSTGLSGFFDLFVDEEVGNKIDVLLQRDGNRVRLEDRASPELLKRLKETQTLERLVDVTKNMEGEDFDRFIAAASKKDPFDVLKDLEVKEIPSNPHGVDEIIKKIAKGFKNFEKFFTDVKKSLDVAAQRFEENNLSWNKVGYYGFSALAQISRFSNLALCVLNIVSTVEGARQLRIKIAQAEVETNQALADIADARVKGAKLLELQKSLHNGVNSDIDKMARFLANPLQDIKKVPASFSARVRRIQAHIARFESRAIIQGTSLARAQDLKLFMTSVRGVMQGFFKRILGQRRAVQLALAKVELEDISTNLETLGLEGKDSYQVLRLLAFSDEFASKPTYDSFPLACIRDGSIQSEADLRKWEQKWSVPLVPEATKQQIKTYVEFWSSPSETIARMLAKSEHYCNSISAFALEDTLLHINCSQKDVLAVIAGDVLPDKDSYLGEELVSYRTHCDCSF